MPRTRPDLDSDVMNLQCPASFHLVTGEESGLVEALRGQRIAMVYADRGHPSAAHLAEALGVTVQRVPSAGGGAPLDELGEPARLTELDDLLLEISDSHRGEHVVVVLSDTDCRLAVDRLGGRSAYTLVTPVTGQ